MHISKVTTCVKVADVVKNTNLKKKRYIEFDYSGCEDEKYLKLNTGRVYIFTSNGIIKKIGYSKAKGGIKGTLSPYQHGLGGRPSTRTMGVHFLLFEEINKGCNAEVYAIFSGTTPAKVKGLFKEHKMEISASHEMEERCKEDYKKAEGQYPEWNYQENHTRMPQDILRRHSKRWSDSVRDI